MLNEDLRYLATDRMIINTDLKLIWQG